MFREAMEILGILQVFPDAAKKAQALRLVLGLDTGVVTKRAKPRKKDDELSQLIAIRDRIGPTIFWGLLNHYSAGRAESSSASDAAHTDEEYLNRARTNVRKLLEIIKEDIAKNFFAEGGNGSVNATILRALNPATRNVLEMPVIAGSTIVLYYATGQQILKILQTQGVLCEVINNRFIVIHNLGDEGMSAKVTAACEAWCRLKNNKLVREAEKLLV